jgi:hypothetical protein
MNGSTSSYSSSSKAAPKKPQFKWFEDMEEELIRIVYFREAYKVTSISKDAKWKDVAGRFNAKFTSTPAGVEQIKQKFTRTLENFVKTYGLDNEGMNTSGLPEQLSKSDSSRVPPHQRRLIYFPI